MGGGLHFIWHFLGVAQEVDTPTVNNEGINRCNAFVTAMHCKYALNWGLSVITDITNALLVKYLLIPSLLLVSQEETNNHRNCQSGCKY